MMFLAVDPGSVHLGWALFDIEQERPIEWGEVNLAKVPYERRFMEIHRHLFQITYKWEPGLEGIAVEAAIRFRGKKIPELEVAVGTIYRFGCDHSRGPKRNHMTRKYAPATWKASITGSSKADKAMVDRVVRLQFPDLPEGLSDHIMDAIGIGLHHLAARKLEVAAREAAIREGPK